MKKLKKEQPQEGNGRRKNIQKRKWKISVKRLANDETRTDKSTTIMSDVLSTY